MKDMLQHKPILRFEIDKEFRKNYLLNLSTLCNL